MLINKTITVVLGMHRSGTSAVTRGLAVLGIELGNNLMPAQVDNETGFWEDLDIYSFNNDLLKFLGSDYQTVEPLYPEFMEKFDLNEFKTRAIVMIRHKIKSTHWFGFKDPRMARLLPFWKSVFEYLDLNVNYVIALRNPMSVVRSLAMRDGFSHEKGYILWQEHLLFSLAKTTGYPRLIVDYDRLIGNPGRELNRIAQTVGLTFDSNSSLFIEYETEFLNESLRHTLYEPADLILEPCISNETIELFNLAYHCATDTIHINNPDTLLLVNKLSCSLKNNHSILLYLKNVEKKLDEQYHSITNHCEIQSKTIEDNLKEELQKQIHANNELSMQSKITQNDLSDKLQNQIHANNQLNMQSKITQDNLNDKLQHQIHANNQLSMQSKIIQDDLNDKLQHQIHANNQLNMQSKIIQDDLNDKLQHQIHANNQLNMQSKIIQDDLNDKLQHFTSVLKRHLHPSIHSLDDLLACHDIAFINATYSVLLKRSPDEGGMTYYLRQLRSGIDKLHILNKVSRSQEAKRHNVQLPGLKKALRYHRWRNTPIIGNILRQPCINQKLNSLENQLAILNLSNQQHVNALEKSRASLQHLETQQHPTLFQMPQEYNKPYSTIDFEIYENPLVSIIIPVYGKVDYTLTCLKSIHQHRPNVTFEIIVVDDNSPDNTLAALANIAGIKLLTNSDNLGFIHSCNRGANAATGQYLYFLNNDTEVTAHWLDELVCTFDNLPGTGLVGSKLIYPDGTLQEAGGIIWQDGSAWNFGRNQDASLPIYNYAREVDYCSGASIMIPRDLFNTLGGFDKHYTPAYCEDSDLALKIRENGYRVIYQPLSVVIHHEGITSGTDTTQGAKAYQIQNTKKQFSRWEARLKNHQRSGESVDNAKDRTTKRRVLVLDHCTPTPDQDSGSITALNLMILLHNMGFQVTFIPEDNFLYMPEYTTQLQKIGIEVLYAPYVTSVKQHLIETENRYDLALLFRPAVAERHLRTIRKYCHRIKVLYHTIDLHYLRMTREATLFNDPELHQAVIKMKQQEFDTLLNADASIVLSSTELEILRNDLPKAKFYHLPHILNIPGTQTIFKDRRDIVFIGGSAHPPNVDAVQYFVKEVMPLLRKQIPGIRFYVVGHNPTQDILDLACDDVIITGMIKELNPFLDKIRVAVAPLRFGAGIKGKIGSTMTVGLPSIATSIAAEGMSLTDGENILIADTPKTIADAVSRVYLDESLWSDLSKAGISFAEKTWGSKANEEILRTILKNMNVIAGQPIYPIALFSSYVSAQPLRQPEPSTVSAPMELCQRTPTIEQLPSYDNITNHSQNQRNTQPDNALLSPFAVVNNKREFHQALSSTIISNLTETQEKLVQSFYKEYLTVHGFCVPCNKTTDFIVDLHSGGTHKDNQWSPNWRERVECSLCGMNNRQRLMATLIQDWAKKRPDQALKIYLMEHVTPISIWTQKNILTHEIITSEYLGHQYQGGSIINGIRHEDTTNLTFEDDSINLIISNDIFEHIPEPAQAFRECARVLAPNGTLLATFPFHSANDESIIRAKQNGHTISHCLEPIYHGDPLSSNGSLVFTDFGWDVLTTIRESGFSDIHVAIYASEELGHYGNGQLVFEATKRGSALYSIED